MHGMQSIDSSGLDFPGLNVGLLDMEVVQVWAEGISVLYKGYEPQVSGVQPYS